MIRNFSSVCIIPARGGSKGLKYKNIRMCAGKPLLYWVAEAARQSGAHDRIVVSTDDKKIAKVAKDMSIEVQMRPQHLSGDEVRVPEIMPYVLRHLGKEYDYCQLLEPTGPLVEAEDIRRSIRKLDAAKADMIISVCPTPAPLGFAAPIPDDDCLSGWFPITLRGKQRQDVGQAYQLDGNIYIAKSHIFNQKYDYWDMDIIAYRMPASKYVDIDDELDLKVAAMRLEERHENSTFLRRLLNR